MLIKIDNYVWTSVCVYMYIYFYLNLTWGICESSHPFPFLMDRIWHRTLRTLQKHFHILQLMTSTLFQRMILQCMKRLVRRDKGLLTQDFTNVRISVPSLSWKWVVESRAQTSIILSYMGAGLLHSSTRS